MKILIVDDVPFMIMSLQQLLERNKYTVITANSGKEALQILSTDFSVDVVTTDLAMQEIDGVELYEKAKKIERFNDTGSIPSPPFVLLTSCEKKQNRFAWDTALQIARREFVAVLQKPVAEKEILPVLQKVEFNKSIEGQAAEELSDILKRTADELRQSGQNLTADAIMDRLKDELNTTETVPK
jgi:CheY-like chemotaxis protein